MKLQKYHISMMIILAFLFLLFSSTFAYAESSLSVEAPTVRAYDYAVATYSLNGIDDTSGYVALYKKGSEDGSYLSYKKTGGVDGEWKVQVTQPGEYEFRLFKDYFGTIKLDTVEFQVIATVDSTIALNKTKMYGAEKIKATYTIGDLDGQDSAGYIALYKTGAVDGSYLSYQKTGGKSGSWEIPINDPGTYEFRMFKDYFGAIKTATSATFEIVKKPLTVVKLDKAIVMTGDSITASYVVEGTDAENGAGWIGLYTAGTDSRLGYQNTGGRSGTYKIPVMTQPGTYEFRLFKDYFGAELIGKSAQFTVKTAVVLNLSISPITTRSTAIKGKTGASAKITIYIGAKPFASVTADKNGNFTIKIKGILPGAKLSAVAKLGTVTTKPYIFIVGK